MLSKKVKRFLSKREKSFWKVHKYTPEIRLLTLQRTNSQTTKGVPQNCSTPALCYLDLMDIAMDFAEFAAVVLWTATTR